MIDPAHMRAMLTLAGWAMRRPNPAVFRSVLSGPAPEYGHGMNYALTLEADEEETWIVVAVDDDFQAAARTAVAATEVPD